MNDAPLLEQRILEDVLEKTGLSFVNLSSIPTAQKNVADAVLPVLARWVNVLGEPNCRQAIYTRFATPHAYSYLEELVEWWKNEVDSLPLELLTDTLTVLAKPADAERIWKLSQDLALGGSKHVLWAKLASFPTVGRQVKDKLMAELEDPSLRIGALQYISKVDDPRIREWFAARVDSPNPKIRNIAKRVAARGKKPPRGVFVSNVPPDRALEVYSTEVDLTELPSVLKQWERELTVKLPVAVRSGQFLLAVSADQWVLVPALSPEGVVSQFWFRLEDVDVVEFVITKEAPGQTA